jgi:molybdate transport system ATP-binding protein
MQLKINISHQQGTFLLDSNIVIENSATGIFGHSGSGKTTLLRCIAGLIKPDKGRIELNGEVLFDHTQRIFIPPHRRKIGLVFQEPRLFPHWSVLKNLHTGKQTADSKPPYNEEQVIELTGIAPLLNRSTHKLSGGEKQRVSLARALLAYPRLLMMDEPISALDARLKARIIPFLNSIHRDLNIPCLYVSHDLAEILQLSNQIALMKNGRIIDHGPLNEIVHHQEMQALIDETDLNSIIHGHLKEQTIASV